METTSLGALTGSPLDAAAMAKGALRRLALDKLEPTPENYAKAWRQESGEPPVQATNEDGTAIASLIERIVRGIERSTRGWTTARKKESLQRVLSGSRRDLKRLQQRVSQLVTSWDSESAGATDAADADSSVAVAPEDSGAASTAVAAPAGGLAAVPSAPGASAPVTLSAQIAPLELAQDDPAPLAWTRALDALGGAVQIALPAQDDGPHEITTELARLTDRIRSEGATPSLIQELESLCQRAAPVLLHRHHLLDQLSDLCSQLTASLSDMAENESWAKGQCDAMQVKIGEGLSARGIRAVSELLRDTRARQNLMREERERARESLKGLISLMLSDLDELGSQTGSFHDSVGRYADVIEKADSLESLTGVVREMVEESRTVKALVHQTQARLQAEHGKAQGLAERVNELETEMQRLSNEVSTDQLTQIANRRGLMQAFDAERARLERADTPLSVGLLDIDNFKRLNDELGHGAGDEALKSLAAIVSKTLRPTDHVARYGGEEFVVLLPDTPQDEALTILTRLQRSLTGGLFMHEQKQVFVTFSAGVTAYKPGERIEDALERADQALYEAKRSGKNRTCAA